MLLMMSPLRTHALTMAELRGMPGLTPEKLARCFADFKYEFHAEVQDPAVFLATKRGDCDDFAILAAEVLSERGYTPRLVTIRMAGETHVVCYLPERGAYLDYNARESTSPLVVCENRLSAIAGAVGKSFGREWLAAYEFTYDRPRQYKRLVNHILTNPSIAAQARRPGLSLDAKTPSAGSNQAAGRKD